MAAAFPRDPFGRAAVIACLANVVMLALVQFVLSGTPPPTFLFLVFSGLWVFGAAMLVLAPRFGAAGTAAWGLLATVQFGRTHGLTDAVGVAIVGLALAAALLAIVYLVRLVRRG